MTNPAIPADVKPVVQWALEEDLGTGDITAELITEGSQANATIFSREEAVVCGLAWVEEVFYQLDKELKIQWALSEGDTVSSNGKILTLSGNARSILSGERCALNFLQTLSGTATISRHYAELVSHTNTKLLDTRKTIPGLRTAQKYAVAVGGCSNHRMGLYDAFLIKENHIDACGSIENVVSKAKQLYPTKPVEIEVENLADLHRAIAAGADIVMLDNFDLASMQEAVKTTNGRVKLEASGGITQDTLVPIAETGVDYISIGALTKDCRAIDLSMLFDRI